MESQKSPTSKTRVRAGLKFGLFVAPYHIPGGNPTLQLDHDVRRARVIEDLGYDEIWYGEHHSNGVETIASPELMIAAAAQHTNRILLGTGVNSVPYHNPLILADRYLQLDHLTKGRFAAGLGPGQLESDIYMMGYKHDAMRDLMEESLRALVPLVRGETVTLEAGNFNLREARLQFGPYTPGGVEMALASVFTPTGVTLAGQYGMSILSLAAHDKRGHAVLKELWGMHEKSCAAHGNVPRRDRWRLCTIMHIAETREQARRDLEYNILQYQTLFEQLLTIKLPWPSPAAAVDYWIEQSLGVFGRPIIGTPEDGISAVEELIETTGGFGTLLLIEQHCASPQAQLKSLELIANCIFPHFKGTNKPREEAIAWLSEHQVELASDRAAAFDKALKKFGASEEARQAIQAQWTGEGHKKASKDRPE
jgi:limonene 1,2-monooxygenase